MQNIEATHPAVKYCRSIRNGIKRKYAFDILRAWTFEREYPDHPAGLSYMAAQAVSMRMRELLP